MPQKGWVGRPRAPTAAISTPEHVLAALTTGKMAEQGKALTTAEMRSVAAFVTGKNFGAVEAPKDGACADAGSVSISHSRAPIGMAGVWTPAISDAAGGHGG